MNLPFGLSISKATPNQLEHPVVVRHVAATQAENRAAQHRRNMVELELAIGVSQLSPEQRSKAMRRAACGRGA